jgi:anaerobic magnesium-protoporphyrin IX monomethyl ester cyclase
LNVCFVYPDVGGVEHYGARKYYHGIGYLSAVLRAAGHQTTLIYLLHEPDRESFLQEVASHGPDVVAFSSTTHQHPVVEQCARWIKEEQPTRFILSGGTHPTLAPEAVAASPAIDAICVGEGELATRDLVERLAAGDSIADIQNLWVRQGEEWVRNPARPLIDNLDDLPFADRDLFDFEQILARNDGWVDLMAGRGCPYDCSYCCNPGLKARYHGLGRYVRFRSVDNLMGEIEALAGRYAIRTLNFQDDTFTLNRKWALAFCEAYAGRFDFPFWINTRVERVLDDEELVEALARAHCSGVRIGLESGNERLRKDILKRGMSNDDIRRAVRLLRRRGLHVSTCNMIGIPGETPQMIDETIQLNRELAPDSLQFSVFYPYPMTELHDVAVKQGLVQPDHAVTGYYERESVLALPDITPAELADRYDRFTALKSELRVRREHPWRYRARRLVLALLGGNEERLRKLMNVVRRRAA